MRSVVSISLVLAAAGIAGCATTVPEQLLGEPAPAAAAQRTVAVDDHTRFVNVDEGDVVKFESNGRSFVWAFDGTASGFDLARVAPAGMLDHPVTTYVRMPPES